MASRLLVAVVLAIVSAGCGSAGEGADAGPDGSDGSPDSSPDGGNAINEPTCAASGALIHQDDFEGYSGKVGAPWAATPTGISLTTGRNSAQAVRATYTPIDYSPAISLDFGGERLHVAVSYWFRVDPGFEPALDDPTGSGMKWFTMWRPTQPRQTWGVGALGAADVHHENFATHDNSSPDMPNGAGAVVGETVSAAGAWETVNDGAWHRYTIEAYTGTGTDGFERCWVDGVLLFDSSGTHYTRSTEGFDLVVFPSDMVSAPAATHTVDIDDFVACSIE